MTQKITTLSTIGHKETMTSLEIAELTGREHKSIMRSIREMEDDWQKVCGCKFALTSRTVEQPNGGTREVPCYELTKRECLYIATKFNDEARAKLILRWEELENKERASALPNFSNPAEAARAWADQYEQRLALEAENKEMKPKADYFDALVDRNLLTNFTDTAKQLGLKRKTFIENLLRDGYIYRDKKNNIKPIEKYVNVLFEINDCKNDNNAWAGQQTLVTAKGKETFKLLYSIA